MPLDAVEAFELLQEGYTAMVVCERCGDLVWAHEAEWTGMKPYHPECEEELAREAVDEMIEDFLDS